MSNRAWQQVAPVCTWMSSDAMPFVEAVKFVFSPAQFAPNTTKYTEPAENFARVRRLLDTVGKPDAKFKIVHITGTNGKGSTSALTEIALRETFGVKTGLFTSPHLHTVRERIRVNGQLITKEEFIKQAMFWRSLFNAEPLLTVFDKLTLLALTHFADAGVEWAVLEVGMGGRWDATNATVPAAVSGICHISMDHMEVLGNTIDLIAREKSGIMKPGTPVFTSCNQHRDALGVMVEHSLRVGSPLTVCSVSEADKEAARRLQGEHQHHNIAVAYNMLNSLVDRQMLPLPPPLEKQTPEAIKKSLYDAFCRVHWPGRLELLSSPTSESWSGLSLLVDCAHNVGAIEVFCRAVRSRFATAQSPLVLIFGASADKSLKEMLGLLEPMLSAVIFTKSSHFRSAAPRKLTNTLADVTSTSKRTIHFASFEQANWSLIPLAECVAATATAQPSFTTSTSPLKHGDLVVLEAPNVAGAIHMLPTVQQLLTSVSSHQPVYLCCGSVFVAANAREAWAAQFPGEFSKDDWAFSHDADEDGAFVTCPPKPTQK